jgi:hypothetical protein
MLLGACSFSAANSDAVPIDAKLPDADNSACAGGCGANEACNAAVQKCECVAGFERSGSTCIDINECSQPVSCALRQCENTPGSFVCYAPKTCLEVKTRSRINTDGNRTLFIGGDVSKPWQAYCNQMSTVAPHEYLTLMMPNNNIGRYHDNGDNGGVVETQYRKVRLDIATMAIDTSDQSFADTTGNEQYPGAATAVTSMPLGVALTCGDNGQTTTEARINLVGTRFLISSGFTSGGTNARFSASSGDNGQSEKIVGGGGCGWGGPVTTPPDPVNQNGGMLSVNYQ